MGVTQEGEHKQEWKIALSVHEGTQPRTVGPEAMMAQEYVCVCVCECEQCVTVE